MSGEEVKELVATVVQQQNQITSLMDAIKIYRSKMTASSEMPIMSATAAQHMSVAE